MAEPMHQKSTQGKSRENPVLDKNHVYCFEDDRKIKAIYSAKISAVIDSHTV